MVSKVLIRVDGRVVIAAAFEEIFDPAFSTFAEVLVVVMYM